MEGDRELVFHGIMLNQDTGEGLDRSLFHVHEKYIDYLLVPCRCLGYLQVPCRYLGYLHVPWKISIPDVEHRMVARLEHPDDEQVPVFEDNVLAALGPAELLALLPTVTGTEPSTIARPFQADSSTLIEKNLHSFTLMVHFLIISRYQKGSISLL